MRTAIHIGIDIGTSGVRANAIDDAGSLCGESDWPLPAPQRNGPAVEQSPHLWWQGVEAVMTAIIGQLPPASIRSIAVDATSGTVLLADAAGRPLTPALMYNDARAHREALRIAELAPRDSAAHGAGSGLAKGLWLLEHCPPDTACRLHSQADWISGRLSGRYGICDANNALKLGWDPISEIWPGWLQSLQLPAGLLPEVVAAGQAIGQLDGELAERWGLQAEARIVSGTTDSTAAFLASGARQPGEAVTALGSTLVLKVIAKRPVFAPEYGVYSHPLPGTAERLWLVGGASNSGGAVLRQFFSDAQMAQMSRHINPQRRLCLDYYPLPAPGERFPINDPQLAPRVSPRPHDDLRFFQALLEGIARIERQGYEKLAELGTPYPVSVRTNGKGADNEAWTAIRARMLGVPVSAARHGEAAYGAALLARRGASAWR